MIVAKASADVMDHPERHSQIYSPNPVIIAGQRFREFYYWWVNHEARSCLTRETITVKTRAALCPTGTATGPSVASCCQKWRRRSAGWLKTSSTMSTGEPLNWNPHAQHSKKHIDTLCGSSFWIKQPSCLSGTRSRDVCTCACASSSGFMELDDICTVSLTDMALYQMVGGFTMKGAVSLHSSLRWWRASIKQPRIKSSSGDT